MPIALLIAHPNPARWPGYWHLVPGLPAARGHARRPWRLSSVASHSHPAAACSFLAASSRTLLKNRPIRPGGPYPWPTCLPPACPVPGPLPAARVCSISLAQQSGATARRAISSIYIRLCGPTPRCR